MGVEPSAGVDEPGRLIDWSRSTFGRGVRLGFVGVGVEELEAGVVLWGASAEPSFAVVLSCAGPACGVAAGRFGGALGLPFGGMVEVSVD